MRVDVEDGELRVANTGAPLDADGVAALASLRASAKRDGQSVGRFGVGFAAVLALSDAPRIVSATGGVAFSAAATAEAVAGLSGPAAELARRDGQLPVLRLVWPTGPDEPPVPLGFDTEVRLPLLAGLDAGALLAEARAEAPGLLLALPGLVEIAVGTTLVRREDGPGGEVAVSVDGHRTRWLLARRTGTLDDADAGTLAVEQRGRTGWSVCWTLPLTPDGVPAPLPPDEVLHAPTATAARLSLPARLYATVPLEPDRRHVASGPATDRVLTAAAQAYVDLVRAVDPAVRLALVPEAGFPRSAIDGRLRDLVVAALRAAEWLPGADGADLAPSRATWLDVPGERLPALLAESEAVPGLLAAPLTTVPRPPAVLGVAVLGAAELADRLLGVEMPPAWWHGLYDALAPAVDTVPGLREELGALPVPLLTSARSPDLGRGRQVGPSASPRSPDLGPGRQIWPAGPENGDHGTEAGETAVWQTAASEATAGETAGETAAGTGRTIPGPASVLLPAPGAAVAAVAALGLPGLHVAHPEAVHPLLERLGATSADAAALLVHPAVTAAVERSVDDADAGLDPQPLADAVLALVAEAGPDTTADLAALALPEEGGEVARADELLLPDAALRPLLAADGPLGVLDPAWAQRYPRRVLTAAGVVDGFSVLVEDDPAGPDHDLDDEERWWDDLPEPPARLVAVRDLDLVDEAAWPAALELLARGRDTRAAVLAPGSYTAWWLARHARLGGHRPGHWRLPSVTGLAALYDPPPPLAAQGDPVPPPPPSTQGNPDPPPPPAGTHVHGNPHPPAPTLAGDEAFLAAIGVRADLRVPDATAAADLLARLADPARTPGPALVTAAHAALADAVLDGTVDPADLAPPTHVRALDGTVADAGVVVVLDRPWLAPVLPPGEVVAGGDPAVLAELLDLPLASDVVTATVEGEGRPVAWADLPEVVLACRTLGTEPPEGDVRLHDVLVVAVTRPGTARREVPVWRDSAGRWHAADPVRGLLAVLATLAPE